MGIQQEAEGKGDGTSQATVGYDELIFGCQFDDAEFVNYKCKTNHAWKKKGQNSVNTCISDSYDFDNMNTAITVFSGV